MTGWDQVKKKIPSGKAILHFIILQVVAQLGWNWISKTFTIPAIKEIGSLVIFIAIVFAVAWYLPKLNPRLTGAYARKEEQSQAPERQELLTWYDRQESNWTYYLRLELIHVYCYTRAASPYLIIQFKVRNFLPVKCRLLKIVRGNGTFVHSTVAQGNLPSIEKDIDKKVERCGEDQFDLKLDINGTKLPSILEFAAEQKATVQWCIRGEWYVDIYGHVQLAKTLADSFIYTGIPDIKG